MKPFLHGKQCRCGCCRRNTRIILSIKVDHSNMEDQADVVVAEETPKQHQGQRKPSILLLKSIMPSMRRNFKNTGYAYQFHRGNLCNFLSRTLNIKGAYLCFQCVCLRECIKEISKPTTDFEYLNALFTMIKNTWAKKIKYRSEIHHCGI